MQDVSDGRFKSFSASQIMKFYKIRHKATGLFFKPAKTYEENLSKFGKVYRSKPGFWCKEIYVRENGLRKLVETKKSDWEIIEFETVERQVIQF